MVGEVEVVFVARRRIRDGCFADPEQVQLLLPAFSHRSHHSSISDLIASLTQIESTTRNPLSLELDNSFATIWRRKDTASTTLETHVPGWLSQILAAPSAWEYVCQAFSLRPSSS